MASYLTYRNVLLNNSTVIASTLNAGIVSYSTLTGSTTSTRAATVSTLTGSSITVSTLTGSTIFVSTLSGSTINVSTMTASTILTAGSTISLARNVNVPNRFVEVGCDLANSMYLDFHSSDAALPDYSTRIISQGGATTGTGGLNMYASTIGLVATNGVGIGTTVPSAALDVYYNGGASGTTQANITNFAGGSTTTNSSALNLRIQGAGGGMVDNYISAQYNSSGAGNYSIALKPGGTTVMTAVGNGNVGIGTTVPTSNLQIYGAGGASSTTTMTITNSSNSNTGYGAQLLFNNIAGANTFSLAQISALRDNNAANYGAYMAFYTTNGDVNSTFSERMRISPGGYVGIGVANPYKPLHISGSSTGDISALIANTNTAISSSASLGFGLWSTSGSGSGTTGFAGQISAICMNAANGNTDMAFSVYTGSSVAPNYTLVERMRITSTGNVGIGTTSPLAPLHVSAPSSGSGQSGQIWVTDANNVNQQLRLKSYWSGSYSQSYCSIGSTQVGNGITPLILQPVGGNILAYTETAFGNGVIQVVSGDGSTQDGMSCKAKYNGNNVYASHNTDGAYRGGMNGVNSSSVTFATSSDRRLKDNIHRIEGSLAIVNQLMPVHFRWINDDQYDFGFIAQEVYKVLPHLRPNFSSYIKDCSCQKNELWNGILCDHCVSMNDEPVDENGKPRYYSLDYGKFTPYLLGAIQELTGRTVELESDNVSLKSQVAGLLAWAQTQGFSG